MIKFLFWTSIATITLDAIYVLVMINYSKKRGEW